MSAKNRNGTISLKQLASHLGLSTTTLSLVLNESPSARSIPQETKDRIFDAAKKLNYRPNLVARSLRVQRTHTLGIVVSEVSDNYSAVVLNGIEAVLTKKGYLYLLASHQHSDELLETHIQMLIERQVEGLIAVNSHIHFLPPLPTVNVSGHNEIAGVTNVILNHHHAAELGIGHLYDLGHRKIAVIKGQDFSADTAIRLETIKKAAKGLGIRIDPSLVVQLEDDMRSPEVGYVAMKKLLSVGKTFTALFAFNDVSAIGAIRALEESGLRVPADVSVLGFDDIYAAAYHYPPLTTIRQPLFEMGSIAARTLLDKLNGSKESEFLPELSVEPTLVIRASTSQVSKNAS
jgi:LacI family transcriptional regulator